MKKQMSGRLGGFTLIELLVVVLIIGILAAVALPQYQVAVAKSRLMQAFVIAKSIKDAEEAYYLANGEYTTDLEALSVGVGSYTTVYNPNTNYRHIQLSNKYLVEIAINGYGSAIKNNRVEIQLPTSDQKYHGIYFLFDHTTDPTTPRRWCFGENTAYQQACKSMGGVDKEQYGRVTARAYELPL